MSDQYYQRKGEGGDTPIADDGYYTLNKTPPQEMATPGKMLISPASPATSDFPETPDETEGNLESENEEEDDTEN